MKAFLLSLIILVTLSKVEGQAKKYKPLSIGDKVPNIEITNIINYKTNKAKLSDFKNKIIIIDFWGTTCATCIAALPKINTMQQLYNDKIQVLTVTNFDTKEKVTNTLKKVNKLQNLQLPVVLGGDNLKQLFPHELVSHIVWIDAKGIVRAITGTDYITASNIETVLAGKEINWPVKSDVFGFDYERPFLDFSNANMLQPEFVYSSAFTAYMNGIDATDKEIIDSIKGTITRNHFNHTLLQLCDGSLAGKGTGGINLEDLVLHVKDSTRYVMDEKKKFYAEWAIKNTYCYSYTLPLGLSKEETKEFVRKDLTHWLDLLGITIKKEKNKYVITEKDYKPK